MFDLISFGEALFRFYPTNFQRLEQANNFLVFQGKPEFALRTLDDKGNGIIDANANFASSIINEAIILFWKVI